MNTSKLTSDFIFAVFAQGSSALTGTLLTLALPKVLGIDDFGYWQLFIFYASYVGFFHLGLNDGVYLIHGGSTRNEIDKSEVNSQFFLGVLAQVTFSILIILAALITSTDQNRSFVVSMTAALITISNAGAYLGYLLQSMGETKSYSLSILIESGVLLSGICLLIALGFSDYKAYVFLYFGSRTTCLIFCSVINVDILKTHLKPLPDAVRLYLSSIRVGFKLMVANIAGYLILGIARFFIDANWGIEVFSSVSFALSIATFFMMFISQASMVLFPALRQTSKRDTVDFFIKTKDLLNVLLPAALLLYWPAVLILTIWLPDYAASFTYFAFIFPMCIYEGKMDVLGTTYLKVFRNESRLLAINLCTLALSAVITILGVYLLQSIEFILVGIVLVLGFRELYTEALISSRFEINQSMMSKALIFLGISFSASCVLIPFEWGAIVYLVLYAGYLITFKKERRIAWQLLKRGLGKRNTGNN